jgi:hypothetical protein
MVVKGVEMRAVQKSTGAGRNNKKSKRRRADASPTLQFCNPEDELIEQHSKLFHTFYADESKEAAMSDIRSVNRLMVAVEVTSDILACAPPTTNRMCADPYLPH